MLPEAFERLLRAFGPQHWWPGESRFEIVIGAVLTQNTSWSNVELALHNLRRQGLLSPAALYATSPSELEELIRPAGYFRIKARRLRNLLEFLFQKHGGSLDSWLDVEPHRLREQLLSINGVGPETADSILLYAAGHPTFVVDAYTARVLKRHGWIEPAADYHAIQRLFENTFEQDVQLFNEYHALFVRVGKQFCRKKPDCAECPLRELLPEQGPLDDDSSRNR
jgi:endonuclease-3 related protein